MFKNRSFQIKVIKDKNLPLENSESPVFYPDEIDELLTKHTRNIAVTVAGVYLFKTAVNTCSVLIIQAVKSRT